MAEVAAAGVEWTEDQMVFLTAKCNPVDTASWWKHFRLLAAKLGLAMVKPHVRMLQRGRASMEAERAVYIHPDLRDQHVAAEASHRVFFDHRERRAG
jgi:hypothetical protein